MRKTAIICSVIGLIISAFLLLIGINSIGASGWNSLGTILILPAIVFIIVLAIDFIIAYFNINNGYYYSCVIIAIKLIPILFFIFLAIREIYLSFIRSNFVSNLDFYLMATGFFVFITVPSVCNAFRFGKESKKKKIVKNKKVKK